MRVLVPFDAAEPKTRLAEALDPDERATLAHRLLGDVLGTVSDAGHEPVVLATAAVDVDAPVRTDERPLTPAVDDALADAPLPAGVVMADLGLATPGSVERLVGTAGDVAIAPGRGGGTNALVVRDPAFHVDFHGASVRDHRRIAAEAGLTVETVDSYRLGTDVDERADLAELALHGEGAAADWVRERFAVAAEDGRVTVARR